MELWASEAFRESAPGTVVRFNGPRDGPPPGSPVLSVSSGESAHAGAAELASLLAPGVPIGERQISALNMAYRATTEGGSTCMLLVDYPSIRLALVPPSATVVARQRGETIVRFPAWLNGKTGAYNYVYPRFWSVEAVRVQFGPGWEQLHAVVRKRMREEFCDGDAAEAVVAQSGMTIIPPHLKVLE